MCFFSLFEAWQTWSLWTIVWKRAVWIFFCVQRKKREQPVGLERQKWQNFFLFLGFPFKHVTHFCCFCEVRNVQKDVTHSWLAWCFLFETRSTLWVIQIWCTHAIFTEQRWCFTSRTSSLFLTTTVSQAPNIWLNLARDPLREDVRQVVGAGEAGSTLRIVLMPIPPWKSTDAKNQYAPLRCANVDVGNVSRRANVVNLLWSEPWHSCPECTELS